ncbi:NUDIX domain-containing protein, partial [archaeon]|nr:NUDIX domain-containing protein [archaeon]
MEYVDLINEKNEVIGKIPHSEMRKNNHWHRGAIIIVLNSKNEFLIQKRLEDKEVYPGFYASGAGGCVSAGESYEKAAKRELEEELGIKNVDLNYLFKFKFNDEQTKAISNIYYCIYDGIITIQEDELESYLWVPLKEVKKFISENNYCPDDKLIFERFYETYNLKNKFQTLYSNLVKNRSNCPWSSIQNIDVYTDELNEEILEVKEAIKNKDTTNLKEELGDVLMDVISLIIIAQEENDFCPNRSNKITKLFSFCYYLILYAQYSNIWDEMYFVCSQYENVHI